MRKKMIFIFCILLTLNLCTNAKSIMLGIERLKTKVENALKGPKTSFKDFFEKTKNKISNSLGKIFINGREVKKLNSEEERNPIEEEINEIIDILNLLYWCKQEDFADQLKQSSNTLDLLKEKFKEKYPDTKAPLITFIKELDQEDNTLNILKEKLEKSIDSAKKFDDLAEKMQFLITSIIQYSTIINELIEATESL